MLCCNFTVSNCNALSSSLGGQECNQLRCREREVLERFEFVEIEKQAHDVRMLDSQWSIALAFISFLM